MESFIPNPYHEPVLYEAAMQALNIQENGVYVDATFGGGGHSLGIVQKLTHEGHLLVFDQDPDAAQNLNNDEWLPYASQVSLIKANFRYLKKYLRYYNYPRVNGILADLGVSSFQFNTGDKGFSTRHEGPLDMRMNPGKRSTAADIINRYNSHDLQHMFSQNAEIRNARTLAQSIVRGRTNRPYETTAQLTETVKALAPRKKENQYLAQVFQALRIEVNDEINALQDFLRQSAEVLLPGGRLVVITYHSGEDKPVKNFINKGVFEGEPQKDFYGNVEKPFDQVYRKPVVPDQEEINRNSRARSAKLRVAEKRKAHEQ